MTFSIPKGFLGTRADLVMDIVLFAILLNPAIMALSFRYAKKLNYAYHSNIQKGLLILSLVGVVAFELDVRFSGGERAFLKECPFVDLISFRAFLIFHIALATLSYLAWIILLIASSQAFEKILPGLFSQKHRFYGKLIFIGMIGTAITGLTVYVMAFVKL